MAQTNNQDFYLMALKAIKLQGEQAPAGSDARKLYSTKADSLRNILKTQFGMMNIDADYGAGVALKDTPGGGNIDWNVLSNAADVLGTSQAGSTRSAFDRALGEYLTRNIPAWAKEAGKTTSPSSSITTTSTPTMGGTGAAQNIIAGQPLPSGQPVSSVNSGMQASQAVATKEAKAAGTWNMGTAGGVEPPATTNTSPTDASPTGSGAGVYGDFIKSEYFKNNDFDGYFLSVNKGLNLPTITDPTTGKVTIDWNAKDANGGYAVPISVFNSYGNMTKLWDTMQGLSKEKDSFNAADIENNPVFKEQLNVLDAEMSSLQKQFNLNVDAQLKGLEGSVAANKAGLEYELNTIKREISASNWRSRQSLAASGMAFSGMLGYLYGQNEAKGMDATIRATSISAAEIKAIGEQMAILEGSKLSYSSDLERIYGAKKALARMTILDPQNGRLQEIGKLIDQGIADFTTEQGLVAPSAALQNRSDTATAAQANFDTAVALAKLGKQGIWVTPSADGKSYTWTTGLTDAEQTERDRTLFDRWYKTEGLNLDWANLDLNKDKFALDQAKQKFSEWATTQGLNLDSAKLDLEWAKLAETVRSNKAGQTGAGATNPDGTPAYDQKPDLSILSNSGASPASLGAANTRLMAGTGALNADSITEFMKGTTFYWVVNPTTNTGGWSPNPPADMKGVKTSVIPGFSSLSQTEMENTLDLIDDPVMAAVAYALYTGESSEPALRRWQKNNPSFTDAQVQSALAICNKYYGQ